VLFVGKYMSLFRSRVSRSGLTFTWLEQGFLFVPWTPSTDPSIRYTPV